MRQSHTRLLYLAASCSGAASLIFETVWIRSLGLSFGSTLLSLSLVTAVFFSGLALGAQLSARWLKKITQPLRVYAVLEFFVGLWGIGAFFALERAHFIYALAPTLSGTPLLALKALFSLLVLGPPAIAMGATLPLLVAAKLDETRASLRAAALYAVNTFGAVIGVLLSGLVLIAAFNHLGASLVATAIEWLAASLALGVQISLSHNAKQIASSDPAQSSEAQQAQGQKLPISPLLIATATMGGLAGAGFEVAFFRALHIVLMGTIETLSVVLAAFLFGIASGGALYRLAARRKSPSNFSISLILLGFTLSMLLASQGLPVLAQVSRQLADLGGIGSALQRFAIASLVLVPMAMFSGALLPALVDMFGAQQNSQRVGQLLAANTLGAVLGSLLTGLVMLPRLGTSATLFIFALVLVALSLLFSLQAGRRLSALGAVCVLAYSASLWPGVDLARLALYRQIPSQMGNCQAKLAVQRLVDHQIIAAEGDHGVVNLVEDPPGTWTLSIDGLTQAVRRRAQPRYFPESVLLGSLPAALAQGQARALVIGLGGGVTTEALVASGIAKVQVLELEPRVVEAVEAINDGHPPITHHPRVELIVDDGRNFLQRLAYQDQPPRYDVIASQPTHWWLSGVGNLATDEFYTLTYRALAPGGVYLQWLNSVRMSNEVLGAVVNSMQRHFDQVLILGGEQPGLFYLGGFKGHTPIDPSRVKQRLSRPKLRQLAEGMPTDLAAVAKLVLMSGQRSAQHLGPANRDRDALVETRLARLNQSQRFDLWTMQAPALPNPGPPASLFSLSPKQRQEILLDAAEARLGTPGGWPLALDTVLDAPRPFFPTNTSLARISLRSALQGASGCRKHYLLARQQLISDAIPEGIQALAQACPQEPMHPLRRRARALAALLQIDQGHCDQALQLLPDLSQTNAREAALRGRAAQCLGQDPSEDFARALSRWSDQALPGAAMRWAVKQHQPLPKALLEQAKTLKNKDLTILSTLLAMDSSELVPAEIKARAGRLYAEQLDKKLDSLRQRAQRAEAEQRPKDANLLLTQAALFAPSNVHIAAARILFLLRHQGLAAAKDAEQKFVQAQVDPGSAQNELHLILRQQQGQERP